MQGGSTTSKSLNMAILALLFIFGAISGWFLHDFFTSPKIIVKKEEIPVEVAGKTTTNTIIKYVEKEKGEKTDLDVEIAKPVFDVKVNDKEYEFAKSDNEEQLFDKNKIKLNQNSKINLDIKIPKPEVKRWGIGMGVSFDGEPSYIVKFPISHKKQLDGWAYHCDDQSAIGVLISF